MYHIILLYHFTSNKGRYYPPSSKIPLRLWHSKVGFLTSDLTRSDWIWIWMSPNAKAAPILSRTQLVEWSVRFMMFLWCLKCFVYATIWYNLDKNEASFLVTGHACLGTRHPVADFEGAPHPRPGKSLVVELRLGMGETIQQTRDFDHEVPWHSPKRWVVNTKNGWSTLKWVDGFCLQNIVLRHFACFLFSNRNGQWQASLWGANGTLCTAQAYLQAKAQKNCSNAETNREPEIQKGKIGKLAVAHALAVSRGYQLLKFKLQGLQLQRSHFHVIVSIQRHSLTLSPPLKCPLARLDARHHCCHS